MWTLMPEFGPTVRGSVCLQCGSDLRKESPTNQEGHEWSVDTGVSLDFEGTIAFCETCIVEAADLLGMVTADRHADAVEEAQFAAVWEAAHREDAEREREAAFQVVRALHLAPQMAQVPNPDSNTEVPETAEPEKRGPGRPRKTV